MNTQELLKDISQKEINYGCYDVRIGDISIYSLLRYSIRKMILKRNGAAIMEPRQKVNNIAVFGSVLKSIKHLLYLLISHRHYSTVFCSFPRVDRIGNCFLDKFTDPLIEMADFKNDYIILDHGRAGVHPLPRLHHDKIIYIDFIAALSRSISVLFWRFFYLKYRLKFKILKTNIFSAFGVNIPLKYLAKNSYESIIEHKLLGILLNNLSAVRVIGPARSFMSKFFVVAHRHKIKSFELQHGVTYAETQLYSGYRDEMQMPDFFLAFGDNKPTDVYGIDENRIVNIGWAFQEYVAMLPFQEIYGENDILVVSDPEITDAILDVVYKLAKDNPDKTFHFRPHPHEIISAEQLKMIDSKDNVKVQDKSINITVVLNSFKHILGENSTVLYEAIAINKKVGRLFYDGLYPKYLEESDKECFWEVHNQEDFEKFLEEDISTRRSKCIYSPFNKDLFRKIIGLES